MTRTKLFFVFILFGLLSCSERYYDGSARYVVQGTLLRHGQPVQHELVLIDTKSNLDEHSYYQTKGGGTIDFFGDSNTVVNRIYTNKDGAFRVSFPGGNYTYILKTISYSQVLFNGKYTQANNLIDLGVVEITQKESTEDKE